jgi:polyisoprenoid-binding protein YceI
LIAFRHSRRTLLWLSAGFLLALAGCSSGAGQPTAGSSAATTPVATTAAATTPAPAATAVVATATTAPAAATTGPAATKPAAVSNASVPAGAVQLTIASDSSEARYRAKEQLVGKDLPSDAIGATKAVTGQILVGPDGAIVRDGSKITIDLRTLKSDESRRDNYLQRSTLGTSTHPMAEFVPTEARGLPNPLPQSGTATFELVGDLTLRDKTVPVTWQVEATFAPQTVTGTATTAIKLEDFGISSPRVGPVLSIEEQISLELDFNATRAAPAASR